MARYKSFFIKNSSDNFINFSTLSEDGVSLQDIRRFECVNEEFSVNVFSYDKVGIKYVYFPLRLCKRVKKHHTDLLMTYDNNNDMEHYMYIVHFDSFMRYANNIQKQYYCKSCMQSFSRSQPRDKHQKDCFGTINQNLEFPKSSHMNLKLCDYDFRYPMFVVADFECFMDEQNTKSSKIGFFTTLEKKHIVASYCWVLVRDGLVVKHRFYFEKDAAEKFVLEMIELAEYFLSSIQTNRKHFYATSDDVKNFLNNPNCEICGTIINSVQNDFNGIIPHLHHNHSSVSYKGGGCIIGKTHDSCNRKSRA